MRLREGHMKAHVGKAGGNSWGRVVAATALGVILGGARVQGAHVDATCEVLDAASAGPCAFLAGRKVAQGWSRLGHATLAEAVASAVALNPHLVDAATEALPDACMDVLCLHLAGGAGEDGCKDAPQLCRGSCQAATGREGPCWGMLVDDLVAGASPLECDALAPEGVAVDAATGGLVACDDAQGENVGKMRRAAWRSGLGSPYEFLNWAFGGGRGLQQDGPVYPTPEEPPIVGEVMGDPHVRGFDGGKYDLFGTGPVHLYGSGDGELSVYGRLASVPEPAFSAGDGESAAGGLALSFMHEVGIALGADKATTVTVDMEGGVRVNGEEVPGNTMRVLQGDAWAAVLQTQARDVLITKELAGGEFALDSGGRTSTLRMQDGTEVEIDAIHGSHLDLRIRLPSGQAPDAVAASGLLGAGEQQ